MRNRDNMSITWISWRCVLVIFFFFLYLPSIHLYVVIYCCWFLFCCCCSCFHVPLLHLLYLYHFILLSPFSDTCFRMYFNKKNCILHGYARERFTNIGIFGQSVWQKGLNVWRRRTTTRDQQQQKTHNIIMKRVYLSLILPNSLLHNSPWSKCIV